jgi:hypothetical protein
VPIENAKRSCAQSAYRSYLPGSGGEGRCRQAISLDRIPVPGV